MLWLLKVVLELRLAAACQPCILELGGFRGASRQSASHENPWFLGIKSAPRGICVRFSSCQ